VLLIGGEFAGVTAGSRRVFLGQRVLSDLVNGTVFQAGQLLRVGCLLSSDVDEAELVVFDDDRSLVTVK
jgi:hypothetical protein